jgi:branched-chain amino acid transport system permease protein
MLGGIFGAWFISALGWPAPLALLGSTVVGALFGWLTDVLAIRRVLARSDEHLWLLSTLALATMVQQAAGLWWGTEPKPFPRLVAQDFSAGLADQKYWLPVAVAIALAVALEWFYRRTLHGKLFVASPRTLSPRGRAEFRPSAFARPPTRWPGRWVRWPVSPPVSSPSPTSRSA